MPRTRRSALSPIDTQIKVEVEINTEKRHRDESDDDMDDVIDYKKRREDNIRANQEFFKNLGIDIAKEEFKESLGKKKTVSSRGLKREKKVKEELPRRSSMRLKRKSPEGVDLPYVAPPVDPVEEHVEEHPRPPAGPLSMTEYLASSSTEEDHQQVKELVSSIKPVKPAKSSNTNLDSYIKALSKITLTETRVAKVVPTRAFSIALHPSHDKVLAATGGKWGKVGLFNVLAEAESSDGVCCYAPHSRPVNCLEFPVHSPHKLFSCSYDGSLRCMDMNKEVFDEIYSISDEYDILLRNFAFTSPQTMLVSQSDGCVAMIDTRIKSSEAEKEIRVSDKGLRSVSTHPVNSHIFCTGSRDGTVCVWDQRKLKKTNNSPLSSFSHGKIVSSAYFSPITGNQILSTSLDNKLTVLDCDEAGNLHRKKSIYHNNHTGRWLTVFRASWHPSREDLFVVGSMNKPREVSLFSTEGKQVLSLTDEDFLGSVQSLNVIHPTQNIVAGVNSSGRVHVFM